MGQDIGCERGKTTFEIERDLFEVARATVECRGNHGLRLQLATIAGVHIDQISDDNEINITKEQSV
ncbi:hypothetical protein BH23PAT2_BH23PAT2_09460 [soil metagenome]